MGKPIDFGRISTLMGVVRTAREHGGLTHIVKAADDELRQLNAELAPDFVPAYTSQSGMPSRIPAGQEVTGLPTSSGANPRAPIYPNEPKTVRTTSPTGGKANDPLPRPGDN